MEIDLEIEFLQAKEAINQMPFWFSKMFRGL